MDLKYFLDKISMPLEVQKTILSLVETNYDEYKKYIILLCDKEKAEEAFNLINQVYQEDKDGFHILAINILSALNAHSRYEQFGISDAIYFDTMYAFTRFINENLYRYGHYLFDRGFWTYRQTSMTIFRIGILEYEFIVEKDIKKVSIHIPSSVVLSKENLDNSFEMVKTFIRNVYPDYVDSDMYCNSWLMSPRLKEHLNQDSKILLFQSYFNLLEFDENNFDIYEWVFKSTKEVQFPDLPENTSLQRSIKKSLLNGRWIGKGLSILKK